MKWTKICRKWRKIKSYRVFFFLVPQNTWFTLSAICLYFIRVILRALNWQKKIIWMKYIQLSFISFWMNEMFILLCLFIFLYSFSAIILIVTILFIYTFAQFYLISSFFFHIIVRFFFSSLQLFLYCMTCHSLEWLKLFHFYFSKIAARNDLHYSFIFG